MLQNTLYIVNVMETDAGLLPIVQTFFIHDCLPNRILILKLRCWLHSYIKTHKIFAQNNRKVNIKLGEMIIRRIMPGLIKGAFTMLWYNVMFTALEYQCHMVFLNGLGFFNGLLLRRWPTVLWKELLKNDEHNMFWLSWLYFHTRYLRVHKKLFTLNYLLYLIFFPRILTRDFCWREIIRS
jgi:hypothetical protein